MAVRRHPGREQEADVVRVQGREPVFELVVDAGVTDQQLRAVRVRSEVADRLDGCLGQLGAL